MLRCIAPFVVVGLVAIDFACILKPACANVLQVDLETGRITLVNESSSPIEIAAYSIKSAGHQLSPEYWKSIAANYDSNNGGEVDPDDTWLIFGSDDDDLSEGSVGEATLARAQRVDLGAGVWITGANPDLTFTYLTSGNQVVNASSSIQYGLFETLGADFDLDLDVDGGDFLIWQSGFGASSAIHSQGDANYDGVVNGDDFLIWQSQFGTIGAFGAAGSAATPEPSSLALLSVGCAAIILRGRSTSSTPIQRRRRSR